MHIRTHQKNRGNKMTKENEFKMDLSFERSFLPTRSSNIKIVANVDGEINEKLFRDAVSKLAIRHQDAGLLPRWSWLSLS
jgi:hypothetical protein